VPKQNMTASYNLWIKY